MAKYGEIIVQIGADTYKLEKGLKQAETKTKSFGKQVNKLGGMVAGAFAVSKIISFAKASVQAYDIQAKSEQKLLTALKGRSDQQQRIINLAGDLQRKTLFGDEQTIEAGARLATILGNDENAIKKLLPLVQDLATAKNMDLSMAAELVAKSVGSSTNALTRYGIQIEGDVGSAERLESAVRNLNEQVGGQAAAAAQTGTGALEQMSNQFGDLKEQIGGVIASLLTELAPAIKSVMDAAQKNISAEKKLIESESIPTWKKWLAAIGDGTGITKGYSEALVKAYEGEEALNESVKKTSEEIKSQNDDPIPTQIGLIEGLKEKLKEAQEAREKAFNESDIINYNQQIAELETRLKALTELTGKVKEQTALFEPPDEDTSAFVDSMMGGIEDIPETLGTVSEKMGEFANFSIGKLTETAKAAQEGSIEQIAALELLGGKYEDFQDIMDKTGFVSSQLTGLFSQNIQRQLANENLSEKERKKLLKKQAQAEKASSLVAAIVNTAQAVTKSIAASPLTFGLPWSAIVGALGAAQIGLIAGTPIPSFANEGFVKQPILARIGDAPSGEGEWVLRNSTVRNMMQSGSQPVVMDVRISGEDIYLTQQRYTRNLNRIQ